jgi:hypothetical protein
LKIKCVDSRVNVHLLASRSVPFTLTTIQAPNLALTHKKTDNSAGKMIIYLEPHGAGEVRVVLQPDLRLCSGYRFSGQRYTPISTHL